MRGEEFFDVARQLVGTRLRRAERVRYVRTQSPPKDLDLVLWNDIGPYWFDVGSDGDSLIVKTSAWQDPFEGSDAENASYFEEEGRPVLFEVSGEEPYRAMLDAPVRAVWPLTDRRELLIGVQIDVGATIVNVFNGGDELWLTVGDDKRPRW